jgi:hypothetical protein
MADHAEGQGLPGAAPEEEAAGEQQLLEALEADLIAVASDLAAAECRFLGMIAEFDRRQGWAVHGVVSCAHWLSWRCGLSLATARDRVRVARALESLPKVVESFEKGELSYARARAIVRVATPENEEALVETARSSTGAQLERICRATKVAQRSDEPSRVQESRRSVSWHWDDDGMLILRARLDAEEGAAVIAALEAAQAAQWNDRDEAEAETSRAPDGAADTSDAPDTGSEGADDRRQEDEAEDHEPELQEGEDGGPEEHEHGQQESEPEHQESAQERIASRADALVTVAEAYVAGQREAAGADVYQVVVHVRDGELVALDDGPGLDQPTALRLMCDASLYCVHTGATGRVMSVGATTRRIPSMLRKALRHRDGGCRFPGCGVRRRVDGHHIQHWTRGGPTALHNLVLLCRRHHRAIHHKGFSVVMGADGQPRFFAPDGSALAEVTPMPSTSGAPQRWHVGPVDPAAVDTRWRGERVDLAYVASVLAQRRERDPGDEGGDSAAATVA